MLYSGTNLCARLRVLGSVVIYIYVYIIYTCIVIEQRDDFVRMYFDVSNTAALHVCFYVYTCSLLCYANCVTNINLIE